MTLHVAGGAKIVVRNFEKFLSFLHQIFFLPKFVYFGIIRPEMMKINFFGKIKILTPLIFGPPKFLNFERPYYTAPLYQIWCL